MRKGLPRFALPALAGGLLGFGMLAGPATAQDWSPFDPFNNPARGQQKPPPREREAPPAGGSDDIVRPLGDGSANAVERGDLTPVMAADGSGFCPRFWRAMMTVSCCPPPLASDAIPEYNDLPAIAVRQRYLCFVSKLWLCRRSDHASAGHGGVGAL